MDRSYRIRHIKYTVARAWRRSEPILFLLAGTVLVLLFASMIIFLVGWGTGRVGARDTDLLSAIGTWAIGFAVPAIGGLAAWRALAAKERDRRQSVWRRAIQVAPRSPNLASERGDFKFDRWEVHVEPPEGVDLVQLMIGLAEHDVDRNSGVDSSDSTARGAGGERDGSKSNARETSFAEVHFGGRKYVHPHPFPRDITQAGHANAEERYKKATSRLSPRKLLLFTVDGYRFVRVSSVAYFMDEAPRDIYRAGLQLEERILSS